MTEPSAQPAEDTMSLAAVEHLAGRALLAHGASALAARSLARAVAAAEADGIASHGLAYVPTYCEHLACAKVVGTAEPSLSHPAPAALAVDAACGFAHPAIDLGFEALVPLAREMGIAGLALRNSYNCGVLGYHTERLAAQGLLGLGFTHAPASMAPAGGRRPLVGTNPFAIAVPGRGGTVILSIDQSASVVAKSEIMKRQREGRSIPAHWAFDADGRPTEDPNAALKGSMAPSGGYKGVGVALLVELLASALAGAVSSREASPFSGPAGGPPRTGQFFIAIDPKALSGGSFAASAEALVAAIASDDDAHVPGTRRLAARSRAIREGIRVPSTLLARLRSLAEPSPSS